MYCESCGTFVPDGQAFCSNCGAPVSAPAPAPVAEAPVVAAAPAPAPAPA
ncbi:MAG: zinc-ribbon domain-containing protein, partial [Clostridiales bacterium]|nr:zinc-ribbon domain-containing protein [Clostridiales bacterium]